MEFSKDILGKEKGKRKKEKEIVEFFTFSLLLFTL
jgi:hypothetical protein